MFAYLLVFQKMYVTASNFPRHAAISLISMYAKCGDLQKASQISYCVGGVCDFI